MGRAPARSSRMPTGCGTEVRASRGRTPATNRASRGPPRCTRCRPCSSSASIRDRRRPAGRSPASRPTAVGSTPGSTTSTVRSSRASTAGPSRPARISASMSPPSSSASSTSVSTTAAGTARPRTARCAPPSTRRSTCSTGCSSSSGRPADRPRWATARRSGEEYLLERSLFRRKSTGEVVDPAYLEFAFPYYWHYDVLRALDYFCQSGRRPIRGWPRRWTSCDRSGSPMADGCSTGPPRPCPLRHGGRRRPAESFQHPPRAPRARLVGSRHLSRHGPRQPPPRRVRLAARCRHRGRTGDRHVLPGAGRRVPRPGPERGAAAGRSPTCGGHGTPRSNPRRRTIRSGGTGSARDRSRAPDARARRASSTRSSSPRVPARSAPLPSRSGPACSRRR